MRIYFNLNTVVGKVLEKKSCTAWFIKNFYYFGSRSFTLSERDRYSASCLHSLLFIFCFCSSFFLFSSEKNIKNADSDNSVTV